jgi:error-prone DNA polymerase
VVVNDALRAGVKFLPIDLRYSQAQTVVEGNAIRLSLSDVHGFGPEQIEVIETERQRGPFRSLNDLVKRTQLDQPHVEALVLAGALDYLGERRQLLWDIAEAYRLAKRPRELPLRSSDDQVSLLPMDQATRLSTAFAMTGTSLDAHLTELRRDVFTKAGATPISELPHLKHGQRVKIGGLIVARQHPPSAKGYAFLAVEDSSGMVNVVIAPDVYARDRAALQGAFVLIDGVLQKDHKTTPHFAHEVGASVNVVARQMTAL